MSAVVKRTRRVKDAAKKIQQAQKAGLRDVQKLAKQEAIALTSGGVSSKELARRGHPFRRTTRQEREAARAAGAGAKKSPVATPSLPINRQDGDLQENLRVVVRGDEVRFRVSSKSAFVLSKKGTRTMKARGFFPALTKRIAGRALRVMRERLRAAIRR